MFSNFFNIKNSEDEKHKIINILGLKIKLKRINTKPSIPYLETHLCDHCNLNCKGCGHFCPLVEKEIFIDVVQFEKDFMELSSKIEIEKIRLMGGEPLLHKDINKFIKIARKYFPKSDIRIVTNGILLPQMKEDFWQTLKENNITVDLSKYPPTKDKFSDYLDLLDDYDIRLGIIHLSKKFYKFANKDGNSNIKETFSNCSSKNCVNLFNSKLYTCPACYVKYFNEYFNVDRSVPLGLDIYKLTGKELVDRLGKPIEQCRYCNMINPEQYEWEQSKKLMEEWS